MTITEIKYCVSRIVPNVLQLYSNVRLVDLVGEVPITKLYDAISLSLVFFVATMDVRLFPMFYNYIAIFGDWF